MKASRFSSQEKFNIILESLRGERSIREICREYGIAQSLFYKWREKFFKDARQALSNSRVVRKQDKSEIRHLKQIIGELTVENQILKKRKNYWIANRCYREFSINGLFNKQSLSNTEFSSFPLLSLP